MLPNPLQIGEGDEPSVEPVVFWLSLLDGGPVRPVREPEEPEEDDEDDDSSDDDEDDDDE